MVPAAAPAAQRPVGRRTLPARRPAGARASGCTAYLDWLRGPGRDAPAREQQRRFTQIRLGFNDVLSQFDLFTEAITQRSEHRPGVWLSGLDMLATDALRCLRAGLRATAADVLPGPRAGRGDPPGHAPGYPVAGQPGRADPGAPGADGRPRHRVLAGTRGRPPGGRTAGARRVAAPGVARHRGGGGGPGRPAVGAGRSGSRRSWRTCGRSRSSASARRSA